ncbi:hypothetical protein AAG906_038080 [Vitis piasezkii]|uniref:B box-type domain-containing protein n=2 Tax=Vitis vinifera TaxID=29760 RepID=A0ABY9C436_VITVI|nr:protein RGF1 INDUCIBLE TRANSCRIPTION FACTOR 1 [Vitis vinifera]RVX20096.1 hypothetical protein CK203_004734 [Vitis vinifera]WJZ89791.1 hypothetical protein VitviT2T_008983 [Vitis vinifera]|eukprot:XP_002272234.2 PREDICTED: uncharacterized protein LOC100263681 isoform X2 [Vitis vinifera]
MLVPPWVESFLSTRFYSGCTKHPDAAHKECNMFCIDCRSDAFCSHCRISLHSGHAVIQIRRSSYHNAVKVMEVEKLLDVSGVQSYVVNKCKVVYLDRKTQVKPSNGNASHACEVCRRGLLTNFRFCSLRCKVAGIMENGNAGLVNACNKSEEEGSKGEGEKRSSLKIKFRVRAPPPAKLPPSNSRKRKGIPHRAPLSGHLIGVL